MPGFSAGHASCLRTLSATPKICWSVKASTCSRWNALTSLAAKTTRDWWTVQVLTSEGDSVLFLFILPCILAANIRLWWWRLYSLVCIHIYPIGLYSNDWRKGLLNKEYNQKIYIKKSSCFHTTAFSAWTKSLKELVKFLVVFFFLEIWATVLKHWHKCELAVNFIFAKLKLIH